jgi:GNAT superfamily N-acetyltransferase
MELLHCQGEQLPEAWLDQLDRGQAAAFDGLTARDNPAGWRWLAHTDGLVLGALAARAHGRTDLLPGLGNGVTVAYLWTLPQAQGSGLGARLMRRLLADLPGLGQGWAVLNCVPGLVDYYSRAGFQTVASSCIYDQYPDPDPVMAWAAEPGVLERLRIDPFPYGEDW